MWWKDEEEPMEAAVMFQREGFEGDRFLKRDVKSILMITFDIHVQLIYLHYFPIVH